MPHRLPIILLLLAARPLVAADPPKEPPPSPEEAKVRAVLDLPFGFPAYILTGETFPACDFTDRTRAAELFGKYAVKVTFHDREFRPAAAPTAPGLYGAVVNVVPESGRTLTRYFTLFRVPKGAAGDRMMGEAAAADLAGWAGLDAGLAKAAAPALGAEWFAAAAKDPRPARVLAGLSLAAPGDDLTHKWNDPLGRERQWWVTLKRKLSGADKEFARPFVGPRPIEGEPAPVVREGTPAEAGMKPDAAAKIDAALTAWAADDDQAFVVCVVRRGVIVLHKAYGTRDGKPMTVTTKSWMASATKTMSASLMLQLADQGTVNLDDPVEKYIPAFRGANVGTPLTIRHLYTHTGGLGKWPGEWNRDDLPDVPERAGFAYPFVRVGKEWVYGGQGYNVGGKIIETVSGESVPAFFHNHLLEPLGCDNTDVAGTHADAFSVPLDMAKFGQMLLNKGVYGKWRFFSEKTFDQMLPRKLTALLGPDTQKTFGFGLDGQPAKFGHGTASGATFSVDVPNELVVVMTRNKYGSKQDKYGGKFHEAITAGMIDPKK